MSLLKCPECGNGVSEYAEQCPNCGFPISSVNKVKIPEGYCNINGVLCSKEEIKKMIKEDTIYQFLLNDCKLAGGAASLFENVIEFNNNEIPDDYNVCLEKRRNYIKERTEKNAVHCKYCGSTNVKKLKYNFYNLGKEWHCNNCGSDF